MSEPMRIDLRKLVKAMDGKTINFMCRSDNEPVSDAKARGTIASYIKDGFPMVPMRKDTTPVVQKTKDTSRLARLKATLAELEQERMNYMRQHFCFAIPPKLHAKIEACKDEIKECESYMPQRLSKLMPDGAERESLIRQIIKTHLVANLYVESVLAVKDALDDAGLHGCNLFTLSDEIERLAQQYADIVCHPEFGLSDTITEMDGLYKDMNTLTDRYLREKLQQTKPFKE